MAKLHIIKLIQKDQDIMEALYQYMVGKAWKGACIVAGAGSVYDVTVHNPITNTPPTTLLPVTVNVPCEVMNFTGEIIRKKDTPASLSRHIEDDPSDYMIHLHISVSHGSGVVTGGGLEKAKVFRALNVYALEFDE